MITLAFALLFLDNSIGGSDVSVKQRFQNPMETSDDFIGFPSSGCFSEDGRLYLVDVVSSRVLVWQADGTFSKGFGSKGEGPGELIRPMKIAAVKNELWIWEGRQRISIFDLEGTYLRGFHVAGLNARTFGVLGGGKVLTGARDFDETGLAFMVFHMVDQDGNKTLLRRDRNEGFVTAISGPRGNTGTIKAFMPELDIQMDGKGGLYYGFSQDRVIHQMDASGKIIGATTYQLPDQMVGSDEQKELMDISIPMPGGGRIGFKQLPNLHLSFDHPKANYTQFIVNGDKILFALTPIGSVGGFGHGFHAGTYFVCSLDGGAPLSRGSYTFAEDSRIFLREGRIIACAMNEDDEYEVMEVTLKGF